MHQLLAKKKLVYPFLHCFRQWLESVSKSIRLMAVVKRQKWTKTDRQIGFTPFSLTAVVVLLSETAILRWKHYMLLLWITVIMNIVILFIYTAWFAQIYGHTQTIRAIFANISLAG